MQVIAISGKAFHGKSTVAEMGAKFLRDNGKSALVVNYGDLVKFFATKYFGWDGSKDESGRRLLQTIGTEIFRKEKPNYWVEFVAEALSIFDAHGDSWDYVLVGDVRFPNEIEVLRDYGLNVIHLRIERPGHTGNMTEAQLHHISETALDEYAADYRICNDAGLDELNGKVNLFFNSLIGE